MLWQYYLFLAWPISGWVAGFMATPKWILPEDPFMWALIFICGAVVGPFGFLWGRDKF
jgi:hypothetical protein